MSLSLSEAFLVGCITDLTCKMSCFLSVVLLVSVVACVSGQDLSRPCKIEFTVDISDGEHMDDSITKDGITYTKQNYFLSETSNQTFGCVCNVVPCFFKCCPRGQQLSRNFLENSRKLSCERHRRDDDWVGLNQFVSNQFPFDQIYVLYKEVDCLPSLHRHIIKAGRNIDDYKHVITKELQEFDEFPESFCADYLTNENDFVGLVCIKDGGDVSKIHSTGMIISMPFLVATFLVYALLPDRNLPAKALMCYVLSLLFAYIMLVTIQLNSSLQQTACNTIAFLCYFFFMASFFWMNSSCIDIWLTFSGIKGMTGQRTQERKRFVYYCLYSWGLPLVMTMIVVIITIYPVNNATVDTGIGSGQCWFQNGLSTGIYFYFPIAALLITNITLFITTALKIRNVQRDTKMLNAKDSSKHEKDKQRDDVCSDQVYLTDAVKNRGIEVYDFLDKDNSCIGFNLYVKLLFAMGINWSMEVISWAVQWKLNTIPSWIWYITDFCNAMYGVLIFFIFVFKRNIWLMLKKRYLQLTGRPTQAHSMGTSTHRTTVSQVTSSEA